MPAHIGKAVTLIDGREVPEGETSRDFEGGTFQVRLAETIRSGGRRRGHEEIAPGMVFQSRAAETIYHDPPHWAALKKVKKEVSDGDQHSAQPISDQD
jgi:hypothetical protein